MIKFLFFSMCFAFGFYFFFPNSKDNTIRLKSLGYQLFPEHNLALKCPCKLKVDKADMKKFKNKFKAYKSFVCSAFFNGKSRIYHLNYYTETKKHRNYDFKKGFDDLITNLYENGYDFSERQIAGIRAIHYNYGAYAKGLQLCDPEFGAFIVVESNDSEKDLEDILKTVQHY